jgi:hypothetical protein
MTFRESYCSCRRKEGQPLPQVIMAKMVGGKCAYCGMECVPTEDHVPPLLLLEKPTPKDRITVPACAACNRGFKHDDEYTRDMVASDFRAQRNSVARSKAAKIARALSYKEAKGYADYFKRQLRGTTILDGRGQPLGTHASPDRRRIENTGKHILRGLHFHFGGQPLPRDYKVFMHSAAGERALASYEAELTSLLNQATALRRGSVGEGFRYNCVAIGDAFIFLFFLYDYFWWLGIAVPPHADAPGLDFD